MLSGIVHTGCVDCINAEKNGMHSYRQYFDDIVRDENILVDLQGKNDIHYVDLRITNKCNLRCRMCVPQSSILLARDMKELGYNVSPEELRNAPAKDFDSLISELGPKLDNLKNEIGAVEEELQQQENQIEEVSEEIKNKELVTVNDDKKEKMKEDLESLMKKYGVTNISDLEKFMK